MPDPQWENLKEIFHAAVALAPTERPAYLDRACDGNVPLRQAVESLLKSHEETGFVDQPAYGAAAEMLLQDRKLTAGQTVGRYRIVSLIGALAIKTNKRMERDDSSRGVSRGLHDLRGNRLVTFQ